MGEFWDDTSEFCIDIDHLFFSSLIEPSVFDDRFRVESVHLGFLSYPKADPVSFLIGFIYESLLSGYYFSLPEFLLREIESVSSSISDMDTRGGDSLYFSDARCKYVLQSWEKLSASCCSVHCEHRRVVMWRVVGQGGCRILSESSSRRDEIWFGLCSEDFRACRSMLWSSGVCTRIGSW